MLPANLLLQEMLRTRLDAMLLAALALAACVWCRAVVRRRPLAPNLPRVAYLGTALTVVLGAGLAEWAGHLPGGESLAVAIALRASLLGAAAASVAAALTGATLATLRRAEIREHADIERQLQHAKAMADAASRAKGDFLAVMSHEIRTPLNAVMGFAGLLAESKLDEIQRGYLVTITSEGARLTSLVNDILDLSKIEEGRLSLERLPFTPVETAQEVLRLLSVRALEKNLDLRFEAQLAGPLLIAGDALRFRQVLLNLVDNAIKFTPGGSVTLFLTWTPPVAAAAQGQLAVRVRDTGIGISTENQKNLFQMFTQADASVTRRYGGTGLGLAICQRLVALMGGEITVNSMPGQGAEFAFAVPATPVALLPEPATPLAAHAAHQGRRPRVLVVDDIEANRCLLEVLLYDGGFHPDLAATGAEAIRLAAAHRYDAILMDLQMPELDGYAATRLIRAAEPPDRHTPIIALTASVAKSTREKCLAAGMDEYLSKPLDLHKFRTLLANFVARMPAPTGPVSPELPVPAGR